MPELRREFLRSRMNKDLDERLVPNDHYRDALNIEISTSEGSDVGAAEASKGNEKITASTVFDGYDSPTCIGATRDSQNDRIYWFVTSTLKDAIFEYDTVNRIVSPVIVDTKNILNFSSTGYITGANVIDGLLFFTDNNSEPKKINIERFKAASGGNVDNHTQIYGGDFEEQHITTIKKYPKSAPNLVITNTLRDGNVDSIFIDSDGDTFVDAGTTNEPKAIGTELTLTVSGQPDYKEGDILRFTATDANEVYVARLKIKEITDITSSSLTFVGIVLSISNEMITVSNTVFNVELEEGESFFQDKFPRFAYRWKYDDNEYSAFSPFTGVAFIPDDENFVYNMDEGHNVNMVNDVRKITLNTFDTLPPNVTEVDILYKESNAPNIYLVKTLKKKETSVVITSEQIEKTIESNQTLRPYDNVPRKAKAQEIIANRLIYANYLQNYDYNEILDVRLFVKPEEVERNQPQPSAKSLRTYQLGIVYMDEYGRQSPVFSMGKKGTLTLDGTYSDKKNVLRAKILSDAPSWATHYKYYIKENSNEYYNVVMDRYYDGEGNNFWISFPSSERNKIDLDTYLILKKQNAKDTAFDPDEYGVKSKKYKVLDIKPNAPEFISKKRELIGTLESTSSHDSNHLFPDTLVGHPKEGFRSFRIEGPLIAADNSELRDIASNDNFVNQNKYIRIKDKSEINATNFYQIEKITKVDSGDGSGGAADGDFVDANDYYEFTLVKNLGADTVWLGTKDNRVTDLKLELYTEENLAESEEFAGRFFVKLKRDDIITDNIFGTSPDEYDQVAEAKFGLIDFNDVTPASKTLTSRQAATGTLSNPIKDNDLRMNFIGGGFVFEHDLDKSGTKASGNVAAGTACFRVAKQERLINGESQDVVTYDTVGVGPKKGNTTITMRYIDYGDDGRNLDTTSPQQRDFNALDRDGKKTTQQDDFNFHKELKQPGKLYLSFAGDLSGRKYLITSIDIVAGRNFNFSDKRRSSNRCIRYRIKLQTPINWSPLNTTTGGGDGGTLRVDTFGTTAQNPIRNRNKETVKLWRKRTSDDGKFTDNPAVWETEPKPSIADLDLFYEASDAYAIADHGTEQTLGTTRNGSKIWYNCFSFGNGVESDRVRDDFNGIRIDKGAVASTILDEPYAEERLKSTLIYSGLFNSKNGVNRLNQFIQAEKITKNVNTVYGAIQKLYARNSDLVVMCEDKILKILADKDAVFNADGNPQLIATNNVLGQVVPYAGDYGISKNPESFAAFGNRIYFADKDRGRVFRLSGGVGGGDGLTDISGKGMGDYFSDNLPVTDKILGIYDEDTNAYHITVKTPTDEDNTVSFKESVDGWPSRKSFIPEWGISLNNFLYTFKNADLYQHNDKKNTPRCNYYGETFSATIDIIFNANRNAIKKFKTLNYEGDGGWVAASVVTDQETGGGASFKAKENKYFTHLKHAKSFTTKVEIENGDNGPIIIPDPQEVSDVLGTTMSNTLTFIVRPETGTKFTSAFTFGSVTGGTTYIDSSTLSATLLSNGNMSINVDLNDYKNSSDLNISIPVITSGNTANETFTLAGTYTVSKQNSNIVDFDGGGIIAGSSASGTAWTTSGDNNETKTLLNVFIQAHENYAFTSENLPEVAITGGVVDNYQVTGPTAVNDGYQIKVVGSISNQNLTSENIKIISKPTETVSLLTNAIWGADIDETDLPKQENLREIKVYGSVGAKVNLNAATTSATGTNLEIDLGDGNGFSSGTKELTIGDQGFTTATIKVTANNASIQRSIYVRLTPVTNYIITDEFDLSDDTDDNKVLYTLTQGTNVSVLFSMENVTNGNVTTGIAADTLQNLSLGANTDDTFTMPAGTVDPTENNVGRIIYKLARDNSTDTQSSVVKVDDLDVTTDFENVDGDNPYNSSTGLIHLKFGARLKIGEAEFHAPGSGRGNIQIPFTIVQYGTQNDTLVLKTAQVLELSKNLGSSGTNVCVVTLTAATSDYINNSHSTTGVNELAGSTFSSRSDGAAIEFAYEVEFAAAAAGLYPSNLQVTYGSTSNLGATTNSDSTIVLKEGEGDKFGRIREGDIGVATFRSTASGALSGTDTAAATITVALNSNSGLYT